MDFVRREWSVWKKKFLLKIFRKDNKIKKNIGFSISGELANCSSSDFFSILSALI